MTAGEIRFFFAIFAHFRTVGPWESAKKKKVEVFFEERNPGLCNEIPPGITLQEFWLP